MLRHWRLLGTRIGMLIFGIGRDKGVKRGGGEIFHGKG